jgi:hypothetical protein
MHSYIGFNPDITIPSKIASKYAGLSFSPKTYFENLLSFFRFQSANEFLKPKRGDPGFWPESVLPQIPILVSTYT